MFLFLLFAGYTGDTPGKETENIVYLNTRLLL